MQQNIFEREIKAQTKYDISRKQESIKEDFKKLKRVKKEEAGNRYSKPTEKFFKKEIKKIKEKSTYFSDFIEVIGKFTKKKAEATQEYSNETASNVKKKSNKFIGEKAKNIQEEKTKDKKRSDERIFSKRRPINKSLNINQWNNFIKRKKKLNFLKKIFKNAYKSRGNICFVYTKGVEKEIKFFENLKKFAERKGGIFINVNCNVNESKSPYIVFQNVLNEYFNCFKLLSHDRQQTIKQGIYDGIGNSIKILLRLNPIIKKIFNEAPSSVKFDIHRKNKEVLKITSDFFCNLGEKSFPLVLLLNNFQWADKESQLIIQEIANKVSDYPLFILCSYVNVDADTNSQHLTT